MTHASRKMRAGHQYTRRLRGVNGYPMTEVQSQKVTGSLNEKIFDMEPTQIDAMYRGDVKGNATRSHSGPFEGSWGVSSACTLPICIQAACHDLLIAMNH
eukprot:756717-Hanusia_phi.AAC.1